MPQQFKSGAEGLKDFLASCWSSVYMKKTQKPGSSVSQGCSSGSSGVDALTSKEQRWAGQRSAVFVSALFILVCCHLWVKVFPPIINPPRKHPYILTERQTHLLFYYRNNRVDNQE